MESIVFSIQHLIFALVSTYYVTNFAIAGFFANRIDRYFAMCMLLPTFIFHCSKVKTAASVRSAADRSIAEMVVHDSVLNDDLFGPQSTTEVWPHYFLSLLLCNKIIYLPYRVSAIAALFKIPHLAACILSGT